MRKTAATLASFASFAAALTAFAPDARANGRFPESNAVIFSANDPDLVLLRVTFGLVVSHDRGKTWDWICEQSIGVTGVEDPMFAVMPDGTYAGSMFQGFATSRDRGCTFSFGGGNLADQNFIDLTTRAAEPNRLVTMTCDYAYQDDAGDIFYTSNVYESNDQAKTFVKLGTALDPTLFGMTVDLAPSDPDRIYVSAVRHPGNEAEGFFLTSKDHGQTFEERAFPLIAGERAPYIAAVDPTNPSRIYVRTSSGEENVAGSAETNDRPGRLLVSDDEGVSWRTVFTSKTALRGFALAKDGSKVYLGSMKDGLQVASTTDFAFHQVSDLEIGCLALADDGLWACSNERSAFILGRSTDDGATFEPLLHFCDIRGPLACPASTNTATMCGGETWDLQEFALGCQTPADAGAATDAGRDAGAADAGSSPGAVETKGGCTSCTSTAGSSGTPIGAAVCAVVAATTLFVRRKRR